MDVRQSKSSKASTDHGVHDGLSKFLNAVNLDDRWPLEGEFDMHICLMCLKSIEGLSRYLLHKLRDCPKLKTLAKRTSPTKKPEIAAKSSVESCSTFVVDDQQQLIQLTELDLGSSCEIVELKNNIESTIDDDDDTTHLNDQSHLQECDIPSPEKKRAKQPTFKTSKSHLLPQNENVLLCQPCGVTCTSTTSLVNHLASLEHWQTSREDPVHEQLILEYSAQLAPLAPHRCTICPFYFNRLEDLANHCLQESETHKKKLGLYRQLMCTRCDFRCRTIEELLKHLNCIVHKQASARNPVTVSGTDDFFCTNCSFSCKRQHALLFHIKLKHAGEIYCKDCKMTFNEQEALNLHILETDHQQNIFSCALCPFFGRSKLSFQEHLKRVHHQDGRKSTGGVKQKPSTNAQNAKSAFATGGRADILQQHVETVDSVPLLHAMLQIQKIQTTVEETSSGSTGKEGSITFVKVDNNCNSENSDPYVMYVIDNPQNCADVGKTELFYQVPCIKECNGKSSEHESSAEKSEPTQKQDEIYKQCIHCNLMFDNQNALKNHFRLHHPEKYFQCKPCVAAFCSQIKLESHLKGRLHACNTKDALDIEQGYLKPSVEFSCKYCTFRTATKAGILFHEVMHVPRFSEICTNTTLETQRSLESIEGNQEGDALDIISTKNESEDNLFLTEVSNEGVLMNDADTEDGIYVRVIDDTNEVVVAATKCSEQDNCVVDIDDKPIEGMLQAVANDSVNENVGPMASDKCIKTPKLYSCPICQESFTATKLRFHLIDHTGEKIFTCTICSASFSRQASLAAHRKDQHEARMYCCPKCNFSTNRKIKLDQHVAIHEGDKRLRKFPCKTCGITFYTSSAVQTHMLIHAANKGRTVQCTFKGCPKLFRYPCEMLYHKRVHGEDFSYLCEICGFATKSLQLLRKHKRSHDELKKFKCLHCDYTATHSYHLSRHMRIHCKVKPFSCPHCEFTCNNQENLRRHVLNSRKHFGLKVYPCRHCDFGCNLAEEMKRHMLEFHDEIAKQYDVDNATFASLVTGIFNPESDLIVPSEEPPNVPSRKRQKLNKNNRASSTTSTSECNVCSSNDGSALSYVHNTETIENNPMCEVDMAVENLVEFSKMQLETPDILVKPVKIECSEKMECPGDAVLNENVLHYQLFEDTDTNFAKEEFVIMDVQDVTICAAVDP